MSDADDVIRIADDWLKQGKRICIATVVRREGSAPREVGAKMVISADGTSAGSVGGGPVEQRVLEKATEVMKEGKPLMLDFDLSGDAADVDALCGGKVSVFLEPLGETKRVWVIGAGHIGKAVARLACSVGFAVNLVDDRAEHVHDKTLPAAAHGIVAAPGESGADLDLDESSFIVICTGGHAADKDWLRLALRCSPRYLGMLGSRNKAARIFDDLAKEGFTREALDEVHVPIGLDIHAETPEEIAVSIVAELILEWRQGKTG